VFDCCVGTPELWPFLILVEVGPALVSLLILPFLPETPRYLLLVRQNRDAARKGQFTRTILIASDQVYIRLKMWALHMYSVQWVFGIGICMIYQLKHWSHVCLRTFVVHCGLNRIKLTFGAQYTIVILSLLTYLLSSFGLGFENAGFQPSRCLNVIDPG